MERCICIKLSEIVFVIGEKSATISRTLPLMLSEIHAILRKFGAQFAINLRNAPSRTPFLDFLKTWRTFRIIFSFFFCFGGGESEEDSETKQGVTLYLEIERGEGLRGGEAGWHPLGLGKDLRIQPKTLQAKLKRDPHPIPPLAWGTLVYVSQQFRCADSDVNPSFTHVSELGTGQYLTQSVCLSFNASFPSSKS